MSTRTLFLTLSVVCSIAVSVPAVAGITPRQKCASAKMKSVGKAQAAKAKCYAKSLGTSSAVVPDCLQLAEAKFGAAFLKAEAGDCLHVGDAAAIGDKIDQVLDDIAGDLGCGNGRQEGDEACDDSNVVDGDGCNASCTVEAGFSCTGEPSVCSSAGTCGNGVIDGSDQCDDGNVLDLDGCSACAVETGFACGGEPSICVFVGNCGNGVIDGGEQCDDGDFFPADGCDSTCNVEDGYLCAGQPSFCLEL